MHFSTFSMKINDARKILSKYSIQYRFRTTCQKVILLWNIVRMTQFSIKWHSVAAGGSTTSNNLGNVTAFSLRQVYRGCVMELLITLLLWLVQQQQQQNKHANWPYNYYYVGEQTNTCKTWRPSWKFWSIFLSHVWDNHKILNFHRANIAFMALSWALKNKGSFFGGHSKCV